MVTFSMTPTLLVRFLPILTFSFLPNICGAVGLGLFKAVVVGGKAAAGNVFGIDPAVDEIFTVDERYSSSPSEL